MNYPTIQDAIDQFIDGFHHNERSGTTYRNGLNLLMSAIEGNDKTTDQLNDMILEDLFSWMSERDYSRHTIQSYSAYTRRFLQWLDVREWLAPDFRMSKAENRLKVARGARPRGSYSHKTIDGDLPLITSYYDNMQLPIGDSFQERQARLIILRNRAIVHTLYSTGGRASEVLQLSRRNLLDGRRDEAFIIGKGGHPRALFLAQEAMDAIRAYCKERDDENDALFVSHGRSNGNPLTRNTIWKVVKDAAKALDLHESTSPHSFRHYRATQLLNEGMPLESIQKFLGHKYIDTTRTVYAHTETAVLKDQLATFGLSPKEALQK